MWVYEAATDTWMETTSLPDFRAELTTSVVNGKIYAIGGTPRSHNCQATSTVYELSLDYPPPDFNGDGVVNGADAALLVDHWLTDDPSFDIAPWPCGDGIVDTQDLLVLAESIGEVQDPTLTAHWALDEAQGMTAHDSVNGNDDSVFGDALWQPDGGKIGGALELDGIDDCILSGFGLNPADGPFSILAWVKGGAPGQTIVSVPATANWLMLDAEGRLATELTSAGRVRGTLTSETDITDGAWHRIGLVWDGSQRRLCVDEDVVAEDMPGLWSTPGASMYIGVGQGYTAGTFFSGLIDDVRIYARAVEP